MPLIVEMLDPDLPPPARNREGDAAMDVRAPRTIRVVPGATEKVGLGFKLELPEGHCALVIERSGHAADLSLVSIGPLVDQNYRGEVHAILHNAGTSEISFSRGDRIAQLLVVAYWDGEPMAGEVRETARGSAGIGSSGNG